MQERLKELMDAGLSQIQALEVMIIERKALQKSKNDAPRWTLLGNFKCPVCQKYSKSNLHGSGWGQNMTLRVTCDTHGVFTKEPQSYWRAQQSG